MIAACPKCQTRYRVESERLGPDGARLRCSHCSAVFRVRLPEPPRATPSSNSSVTDEAPRSQAALQGTAPASGGAFGAGARSEAKSSEPSEAHKARAAAGNQALSAEGRSGPRTSESLSAGTKSHPSPDQTPTFDHSRLVLIAHPNADACKHLAEALEREGLQVLVAHDGVEAILSIQRALPRAVVLDAALPKMFGFQVCELVKRNESLRVIQVCLMGAIHKDDRYRRAPNELYGADFYLEPPALPGALLEWLARLDFPLQSRPTPERDHVIPAAPSPTEAPAESATVRGTAPASGGAFGAGARSEAKSAEPSEAPASGAFGAARSEPKASEAHQARATVGNLPPDQAATKLTLGRPTSDPLSAERAQAERLARIIVSDIVLYNEEKFAAAVRGGSVLEALAGELVRVARGRGMQ